MAEKKGWIALHRSIQNHYLWEDKPFNRAAAWVDMLLLANHQDNKFLLGNKFVEVERGSFITSELKLMERWGWSKTKVRAFLQLLENDSMIVKKTDRKKTTITIVKYSDYQDLQTTEELQKNHRKTTKKPQKDTNNNDRTMKNNEEQCSIGEKTAAKKSQSRFTPPTPDEVREYARSIGFETLDAEHFCDYYEQQGWELSNGRKMKDWKSAVRNWQRRERNNHTEKEKEVDTTNEIQRSGYGEINYL